jgi:hypothetical protein
MNLVFKTIELYLYFSMFIQNISKKNREIHIFGQGLMNQCQTSEYPPRPEHKSLIFKKNYLLKGKQEVQWLNSGERKMTGGKKELEKRNGGADQ